MENLETNKRLASATSQVIENQVMRKVYSWMALALVVTAITAWGVASTPALLTAIFTNQILFWGLIIGELVLVWVLSARIDKMSFNTAVIMFMAYSLINGATLSSIFVLYTGSSIAITFFITAAMFGAMSVFGYFTQKDMSSWGKYLLMALVGLIIASIVNIFVASSKLDWIISYVGVVLFTLLTAYDTQKIKNMLSETDIEDEGTRKLALLGSLSLYLDFINLFLYILRIFGRRD